MDSADRQRFKCPHCSKVFTRRTHTTKSGSHLSDRQWELGVRLFSTRGGMSGEDLARILGINRKTAQRLNRTLRLLVRGLEPKVLPGCSEWDESTVTKAWVGGGVSRQTRQCLIQVIADRRQDTLIPLVEHHTDAEAMVFTDEHWGYDGLMNHWTVCHAREFVNSQAHFVHTNGIEGVWGHFKPLSWHVYRGIPLSSLPQYLSEFMFRYNLPVYETRVSVLSALLTRKTNLYLV